jgi:hypothetical protein
METHDTGWRASRPDTARRRLGSFLIDWSSRDRVARNQVLSVRLRFGFCILWMAVGFCIPLGFRAHDALHGKLRAESENRTDAAKDSAPAWEIERRFGRRMFDVAGETLRADVYLPQGEGPFPGVMMIHGGGWVSGSRLNLLAHANAVARAGFMSLWRSITGWPPVIRFPLSWMTVAPPWPGCGNKASRCGWIPIGSPSTAIPPVATLPACSAIAPVDQDPTRPQRPCRPSWQEEPRATFSWLPRQPRPGIRVWRDATGRSRALPRCLAALFCLGRRTADAALSWRCGSACTASNVPAHA